MKFHVLQNMMKTTAGLIDLTRRKIVTVKNLRLS